jgi:hypothetical protein
MSGGQSVSKLHLGTSTMPRLRIFAVALVLGSVLPACVSLAPGADKVRITKDASDVSTCTAVGNIKVPRNSQGNVDIANAEAQFRNQTVGLGGNTGFVTYGPLGVPVEGVAYRCPNQP